MLSSPNSPLQTLLYRHPYLSGIYMNYLYIFIWSKKKLNYHGKKHTNTCVMYTYTLHNICRNVLTNSLDSRMSKFLQFLLTILRSIFKGNPVTSLTGVNGSPNPLTIPGSGTTVFPLPGSFPWAAGARGKCKIIFLKYILLSFWA